MWDLNRLAGRRGLCSRTPSEFAPVGGKGHVARDRCTDEYPPIGRRRGDGNEVVKWLSGLGVDGPIESYAKRYAAIATDLATGRGVWLERGPILEAVRASIALPGIS